MAGVQLSNTEVLTFDERWRRWQQRGRDRDARLRLRMRRLLLVAGLVAAVVFLISLR
jgi:hypothetical protein